MKRRIPAFLKRGARAGMFTARKYLLGFRVSAKPHLDAPGEVAFREILSRTSSYLEYGAGSSTVLAWQYANVVVAVESDARMLVAVRRALPLSGRRPALSELIYVDIGFTRAWGAPVFTNPTPTRLTRWERYASAPWEFLAQHEIEPDTILIDGRFRVACALMSLLRLPPASRCLMLIDDYGDRPHYAGVLEFADLVSMHGRMAVFRKKMDFDGERCRRVLQTSQRDWR